MQKKFIITNFDTVMTEQQINTVNIGPRPTLTRHSQDYRSEVIFLINRHLNLYKHVH